MTTTLTADAVVVGSGVIGSAVALELARALQDGPLDVVLRHVGGLARGDRRAKPRIGVRILSAHPGRYGDLLDQLGENLPPLGVCRRFLVLDAGPL